MRKTMQVLAIAVAAVAFSFTASAQESLEKIQLGLTNQTSPAELEQIQAEFAENDIEMVIKDKQFICDRLAHIDFTIVYNNSERVGMKTYKIRDNHTIWITATPRENGTYGFRVGGDKG